MAGTRAHRAAVEIVRGLDVELQGLRARHVRRLIAINRQLIAELEADMRRQAGKSWTTARTQALLAREKVVAKLLAARFERRVMPTLEAIAREAGFASRSALVRQLAAWADAYPGALNIGDARPAGELLEPGLVDRYNRLTRRWSKRAVNIMHTTLEQGSRARETAPQTWKRLAANLQIEPWRAERIVRTELAFANNRRAMLDFKASAGDLGIWNKQLVATFDQRTGDDSRYVHLQTRAIDEDFADNIGNVYPHPPNRPNDREVMLFVPNLGG